MLRGERVLAVTLGSVTDEQPAGGYALVIRDVSDEQRLEAERRQLDRRLFLVEKMSTVGELAAGVMHEIGNPLAGMKAVVQSLLAEGLGSEMADTRLRRLDAEITRLSGFLRGFSSFAAAPPSAPEDCELQQAVADAWFWVAPQARQRGATLERDLPAAALWLRADPHQLQQVLLNLLLNALHAVEPGGRIRLAARAGDEPGIATIRIEDDGCGIPEHELRSVFEPFHTTRPEGSGLGLAIVRQIAARHGATVALTSRQGLGTRVLLRWPLAGTDNATIPGRALLPAAVGGNAP